MYRREVITTPNLPNSFSVCLPGHNSVFPRDNQSTQANYVLSFKPELELNATDWSCYLRSVCYSNSYSTFIPETPLKKLYMLVDKEYNTLIRHGQAPYVLTADVEVHNIYHGYVIWTSSKSIDSSVPVFKKGLYFHLHELMFELNRIYKEQNVDAHFRSHGDSISLTLKRAIPSLPWELPYFENDLADKIGLPNIRSKEMQQILAKLADANTREALEITLTFRPNQVIRDKRRNIGLYIDFLSPRHTGLRQNEVIRLPGRLSGRFFDTNIIDFHHPIPLPIFKNKIKLVRVQFKDENGDDVTFPLGQNMIILEFRRK